MSIAPGVTDLTVGPRPETTPTPAARPRRLLLVTGSMGQGHHAAARAVEERARRAWPGVEVVWTETLDGMGRGTGPLFRGVYAGCVRHLPWLYELYFRLLWHVAPFRAGTRAVIGAWSARGLAPVLDEVRPDLVVATFPEGITGLAQLRRRGRLDVPAVARVAAPPPHPLGVDAGLARPLGSTPAAVGAGGGPGPGGPPRAGGPLARRAAPGAAVLVGGLPVAAGFTAATTHRERPLVYVSCGSLAFGDVTAAAAAVLDAGADALVSCGRDAALRRRLDRLVRPDPRPRPRERRAARPPRPGAGLPRTGGPGGGGRRPAPPRPPRGAGRRPAAPHGAAGAVHRGRHRSRPPAPPPDRARAGPGRAVPARRHGRGAAAGGGAAARRGPAAPRRLAGLGDRDRPRPAAGDRPAAPPPDEPERLVALDRRRRGGRARAPGRHRDRPRPQLG